MAAISARKSAWSLFLIFEHIAGAGNRVIAENEQQMNVYRVMRELVRWTPWRLKTVPAAFGGETGEKLALAGAMMKMNIAQNRRRAWKRWHREKSGSCGR